MKQKKITSKKIKPAINIQPKNFSDYFGIISIIIFTFLLYIKVINLDFIMNWDDYPYFFENSFVTDLNLQKFVQLFNPETVVCANYHPITIVVWGLFYKFFGLNPAAFHLLNLVFHLLNILLVFFVVETIFKRKSIALISSLIFAIHPMHVESVAWLSEFKDVLFTFFFLLALIVYLKFIKTKSKIQYFISVLFFVLSALSKPAAICLPIVLLLIDYYVDRKNWKFLIVEKIPFFIISLFVGWATIHAQSSFGAINSTLRFNFFDRIFLASYAIIFYIFKLLIPINFSAMHYFPEKQNGFLPLFYYFTPFILLIMVLASWLLKKHIKVLIFGFLFYLITIALVIQFIPVGGAIVSERYSYIPYIGLSILIGYFYQYLRDNKLKSEIFLVIFSVFILFSTYQTWNRIDIWKNGETLFTDVTEKYPLVSDGFSQLAHAKLLNNEYEGVYLAANKAIMLSQNNANAFYHRGTAYLNTQKYELAINDFDKAIALNPQNKESLNNRGLAKKAISDFEGALKDFTNLIQINPQNPDAYINRGTVKNAMNDFVGAIDDYNEAIKINPNIPEAYNNRGLSKTNLKDFKGALVDFNYLLELKPNFSTANFNRGNVYFYLENYNAALQDYNRDLEINSKHVEGYINRGHVNKILKNLDAACLDWKLAANLGHPHAISLVNANCK